MQHMLSRTTNQRGYAPPRRGRNPSEPPSCKPQATTERQSSGISRHLEGVSRWIGSPPEFARAGWTLRPWRSLNLKLSTGQKGFDAVTWKSMSGACRVRLRDQGGWVVVARAGAPQPRLVLDHEHVQVDAIYIQCREDNVRIVHAESLVQEPRRALLQGVPPDARDQGRRQHRTQQRSCRRSGPKGHPEQGIVWRHGGLAPPCAPAGAGFRPRERPTPPVPRCLDPRSM